MKIIILSSNPTFGGGTTANLTIAKAQALSGHDVVFNDEFLEFNDYDNLRITHWPVHWLSSPNSRTLLNSVLEENPDVVIWGLSVLCVYHWRLMSILKKRKIRQMIIFHSFSFSNNFKSKIMDFLTSLVIRKADNLIFVSEYTKRTWNDYRGFRKMEQKEFVIHNPIELPTKVSVRQPDKSLNIGYVGRLSTEKQPEKFCELSILTEYIFHVWGAGDISYECLKDKYPNILFHGEERDLEKIYRNIDILILTSKVENCPMVILEAKSRGIPTIAPKVGGIPEVIKDGEDGCIYNEFSVDNIEEKIQIIRNNYYTFSEACIKNSKKYGLDSISRRWNRILDINN